MFSDYTYDPFSLEKMRHYRTHLESPDSIPIGFVSTVTRPAPIYTSKISDDQLVFGLNVNFTQTDVLIRIRSISPQYDWMANQDATPQFTPIGAVAGIVGQVRPVLGLVMPFFLKAQGRLEIRFINSVATPINGGILSFRCLRLQDAIQNQDGTWGWDYGMAPWTDPGWRGMAA